MLNRRSILKLYLLFPFFLLNKKQPIDNSIQELPIINGKSCQILFTDGNGNISWSSSKYNLDIGITRSSVGIINIS